MKSILMEKWGSCAGCVPLDPQLFLQCFSVIRANYTHGVHTYVYIIVYPILARCVTQEKYLKYAMP